MTCGQFSRPDREWGRDFVYQVTHGLLASSFAGYVEAAKKITPLRVPRLSSDLATI